MGSHWWLPPLQRLHLCSRLQLFWWCSRWPLRHCCCHPSSQHKHSGPVVLMGVVPSPSTKAVVITSILCPIRVILNFLWIIQVEKGSISSFSFILRISFRFSGLMGLVATPSNNYSFASASQSKSWVTYLVVAQGVESLSISLSLMMFITLLMVDVPRMMGTDFQMRETSGITRKTWSSL